MKPDYKTLSFITSAEWRKWLADNYGSVDGIWLKIHKKASGMPTVTYAEALDEALCFGWIDGQKKSYDETSFLQKFTPRRKNSLWSKRNIEHIARLTEQGLMMPPGVAEVERAQQDGRWVAAYDTPSQMTVPDDFLRELEKYPTAKKFFATLNKSNIYAIAWRLQTAKTDQTRKRRLDKIVALLNSEQKLQ